MDAEDVFDIDSAKLFTSHTVGEIQKIQKKIQNEIEKKREELRSTVGERYRDLLKAADTITYMRDTSKAVVNNINQITVLCQALQEKRLLGFKQPSILDVNKKVTTEEVSKVLEVRILLAMPEQIWLALDSKELDRAAEFYILAEHIHLGLQVTRAAERFPIIVTQWSTIAGCRNVILECARKELKSTELSPKKCANCLTSLLLLESISLEDLLDLFLALRAEAFQRVLTSDENPTVKDKLRAAALLAQYTLTLALVSFQGKESSPGLLENDVCRITDKSSAPTLSHMPAVSPLVEAHLTSLVKDFRPSTSKPVKSLQSHIIRTKIEAWLEKVKGCLESEMSTLLGVMTNLRGVVGVRERVTSLSPLASWEVVEELLGRPFQIYSVLVESHVTARTLELVKTVWEDAVKTVEASIANIDEDFVKPAIDGNSECDLRWFVWKESDREEIAQKTRGFTHRVRQVCETLDQRLNLLLEDIDVYLTGLSDKSGLLDFLNSCSYNSLQKLTLSVINSAKSAEKGDVESKIIVRARILQALTLLCPHLKKCLRQSDTQGPGGGRTWSEVAEMLLEASVQVWRSWKDHVRPRLRDLAKEKLDTDVAVSSFLLSRPACELVTITEELEDNNSVTSELRVPSQPSFTLQEYLLQISLIFNTIAAHTLPRIIHTEIVDLVCDLVLNHYTMLSNSEIIYQSHAWQLLLDVRFVTILLVSRDRQAPFQQLCTKLEGLIDPFDLNVCYPYLNANVKKSALRLQGTFGVLVDYSEKLAALNSLKMAPMPQSSSTEDPNVLAMSANIPWFPLLPISSGGAKKKEDSPTKQNKQRGKELKKESVSSDFVRSAGAFFGGLTGGW